MKSANALEELKFISYELGSAPCRKVLNGWEGTISGFVLSGSYQQNAPHPSLEWTAIEVTRRT
jgi:hypothetical protein